MPAFAYRAVDPRGARRVGELDAPTPLAASQLLESQGLVVVEVTPRAQTSVVRRGTGRVRGTAVVDVTRALAGLLAAGLPLSRALTAAASAVQGPVAEQLVMVRDRVNRGDDLASALAAHPQLFSPLYVGLVRAGERSGDLAGTFERLANQLEREGELRSKLISAAIYPALLALVGTIAVTLLLLFVLPRFASVLEGAGAHLPRSTALLLAIATQAQRVWPLFLLPPIALVSGACRSSVRCGETVSPRARRG